VKYLAIFRGMNAGGRNTVPMADLRHCLESAGLEGVSTFANSGNAFFDARLADPARISELCRRAVEKRFGHSLPATAISAGDFLSAIDRAPDWWGDGRKGWRHDAIFMVPPLRPRDFLAKAGSPDEAEDRVEAHGNVVFWSVPTKAYGRSPVAKVFRSTSGPYAGMTLRSSTTIRRLQARLRDT
jgi:uncharacterized protein (DUF1697 family)